MMIAVVKKAKFLNKGDCVLVEVDGTFTLAVVESTRDTHGCDAGHFNLVFIGGLSREVAEDERLVVFR